MDIDTFFNRIRFQLILTLKKARSAKVQTTTWIRFKQDDEFVELAFNSRMMDVHNLSENNEIASEMIAHKKEINEIASAMIAHKKEQIENPALLNSRFVFDGVLFMDIDFHLTRGSSYIPLPQWLASKKAIINPLNEDREFFKWAVIAASRWEEIDSHPKRISKLKRFEKDFDWSGIKFPVSVKDIKGFESKNRISINLLATEGKEIYICRKGGNYDLSINLMILNGHYVAIKSLSRLLSSENSKHSKHNGKEYFCMNCLQGFHQEISRDEYRNYCLNNESVKVEMPYKQSRVEFCDGQYQFKVPFVIYADFESLLEPIQEPSKNPSGPWTTVINNHIPSGWCVYSEFAYGKVENPLTLFCGKDCVKKFCNHIIGEARKLYKSFPERSMKPLTPKEIKEYKESKRCHICFRPFTLKDPKVRDHCHYTGNYRGAAHRNCNLRYKIPSNIPIVFHNLSGYDAHLFIKELAASMSGGAKMNVIAKNKED